MSLLNDIINMFSGAGHAVAQGANDVVQSLGSPVSKQPQSHNY